VAEEPRLDIFRAAVIRSFPELTHATFRLLNPGFDSDAVDANDWFVFKFPRHEAAAEALRREASLLKAIRPNVTMTVPQMTLCAGPPLFSRHAKLRGDHLLTAQYETLPANSRQRLAADMALFYAELHSLDTEMMKQAGAMPIKSWLKPDEILQKAWPILPPELRAYAARTIDAWQLLPGDPYSVTYGFFDGHGWNMAFDHESQRLNGIYDFADSGFGLLHQDFIYSNLISADLTARIVSEYEALTGRRLDQERIHLLTGVHRLSELAELAGDPDHVPMMVKFVADWATSVAAGLSRPDNNALNFT
jgi:hypothetical protein